jgi:hypothetical protein
MFYFNIYIVRELHEVCRIAYARDERSPHPLLPTPHAPPGHGFGFRV